MRPNLFFELRSIYKGIKAVYRMNKKNWNTVNVGGDVDGETLKELIDHSYELVYWKLSKREKVLIG